MALIEAQAIPGGPDSHFPLQLLVFPQKSVLLSCIEITVMYFNTSCLWWPPSKTYWYQRNVLQGLRGILDQIQTFAASFVLLSCQDWLTSHQTPEKNQHEVSVRVQFKWQLNLPLWRWMRAGGPEMQTTSNKASQCPHQQAFKSYSSLQPLTLQTPSGPLKRQFIY